MTGFAPRYDPGGMEHVADIRGLSHVSCMVSSPYYDVGVWVYVYGLNTHTLRWCRVTDVSGPKDWRRHRRTKRITELGYNEALSLCGKKYINSRSADCPVLVFRINE